MSSEDSCKLAIQVISCMVEILADDEGRIDQKCFEKICAACIKAVIVGFKVGDQALNLMKQVLSVVLYMFLNLRQNTNLTSNTQGGLASPGNLAE
jgi:hypothetical protein